QQSLQASERNKQSGMIGLSFQHPDPAFARRVLDEVARVYVQQNVERTSAEVANSLEFLREQLPQVRLEMEKAEQRLNAYQISAKSANITIETQSVLDRLVQIEADLSKLRLKQLEMDKLFTREHPTYQTLLNQKSTLESDKARLEQRVSGLPEVQQELLRLTRDMQVSSEIYTQMLQKAQELDIARASTVGNVRIIDTAAVDTAAPVAPKRKLIVIIATLLGGMLSVAIALVHNMLNRGIETPDEIEALDLPVYATVPFSEHQPEKRSSKNEPAEKTQPILAVTHPADITVEALRNLHTSLHFAMLEAPNNIIMLSGPSPKVGKSFISVNLAALMAKAGKKILLIDGDMRRGYLHHFFGNHNDNGLSTLLSKQASLEDSLRNTRVDNLDIITRGPIPPNPTELLLSNRFAELMQELSSQYDSIIIDTPPILAVADALIVAKQAGTRFVVVRFEQNPPAELRATIKRFESNGITLSGAILNATRKRAKNYYRYGYEAYQYQYESEKS
ncbi:MAG TPA: polysaccharide biosynthesis tyrosine autokinase, partial [Pseudomonadales bacterium]